MMRSNSRFDALRSLIDSGEYEVTYHDDAQPGYTGVRLDGIRIRLGSIATRPSIRLAQDASVDEIHETYYRIAWTLGAEHIGGSIDHGFVVLSVDVTADMMEDLSHEEIIQHAKDYVCE